MLQNYILPLGKTWRLAEHYRFVISNILILYMIGKTQMLEPDQEVTDLHADEKKISFRKIEKNCTDDTKENNGL